MTEHCIEGSGLALYLGRQSILDRRQKLHGFELLFRKSGENFAEITDDVAATATVINYLMTELGLDSVLGRYKGFINVSASLLMSDTLELLPKEKVVLEMLETIEITPEIIARSKQLRQAGFTLALDDVTDYRESLRALFDIVDIVKVDAQQLNQHQLDQLVSQLRGHPVKLLAEKIDNHVQLEQYMHLGFELFQGYYFAKPVIIKGKRLSPSQTILMQIFNLVLVDADRNQIENAMKRDPGLSVKLLRLVNSVAARPAAKVHSLSSALVVLGQRQLQRWLQLLLFANLEPANSFPSPLLQLAATRGKLLEELAASDKQLGDYAFIAGIMSLMDVLLSMPIVDVLASLQLPGEVKAALTERSGRLGKMLNLAEALEGDNPDALARCCRELPDLLPATINTAQAHALSWANSMTELSA